MKFEQVMRAARETVAKGSVFKCRRKAWPKGMFAWADKDGWHMDEPRQPFGTFDDDFVILRKKSERDVWKDPRVGDVVQYGYTRADTVRHVDADMVACISDANTYSCTREEWARHSTHADWHVVSRAKS